MNQLLPQEVVDQIMREEQHFAAAPQAFFEVWKRGVEIAGPQWFGDGTRDTEGPVSRESREYFRSYAAAQRALERGGWSQLAIP